MAQCRSCHAVIFWGETPNGRRAPFDPDGQNHFATCPDRRAWRRDPEPKPESEPDSEQRSFLDPPSRYPV
jgi:hypothetical protein